MADYTEWLVHRGGDIDPTAWIEHRPCGWVADLPGETPVADIHRWIEHHEATEHAPGPRTGEARPMTWGTVPAGWYVRAPGGEWFRVVSSHMNENRGEQFVTLDGAGSWHRAPDGPVTACPGARTATDAAIAALGFPGILEDGS